MRALIILLTLLVTACAAAPRLRNVSVEADLSTQVSGDFAYFCGGTDYRGGHVGRVAITLDQPLTSSVTYRLGIEHRSLLDTGRDRGEERAVIGVMWRPFGGGL